MYQVPMCLHITLVDVDAHENGMGKNVASCHWSDDEHPGGSLPGDKPCQSECLTKRSATDTETHPTFKGAKISVQQTQIYSGGTSFN